MEPRAHPALLLPPPLSLAATVFNLSRRNAKLAADVADGRRADSAAAAAARAAAARAAAAATAADAAADAVADAAYAAADAAADAAASKLRPLWLRESVAILSEAIDLGPHNGDELYDITERNSRINTFRTQILEHA